MNKDMLDDLIGDPPPSTVDVDTVIRAVRRHRRRRLLAAGGSTAVAVVAAIVVGVGLAHGPQRSPVVGPPPAPAPVAATPSPSAVPGPTGVILRSGTAAERERTVAWLRAALKEATEEHAPGTKWIYMPDVPGEPRTPDGDPVVSVMDDGKTFQARSGVTGGGRRGGLYLTLRPTDCAAGTACNPFYECDHTVASCAETRTPSGRPLVHYVDKPGRGRLFYGVDVQLRDRDQALSLLAVNYFGGDGSPVSAPAPVLTRPQLDAIATDLADRIAG